jgi:hypothetical protein
MYPGDLTAVQFLSDDRGRKLRGTGCKEMVPAKQRFRGVHWTFAEPRPAESFGTARPLRMSLRSCGLRASGTESLCPTYVCMPKEPIMLLRPQSAEPAEPPVKDPQPYKDPASPPPGDPQQDRPMQDPMPPDGDRPRS